MNLLIVEDEPEMIAAIKIMIESYNKEIQIITCGCPSEAIKVFDEQAVDAALLDIRLPEMSGFDLADYFSMRKPGLSLVFITAYNSYAQEAFDANAVDYVLKPIRKERLYRALDKISVELEERKSRIIKARPQVQINVLGKIIVSSGDFILKWKRKKSMEVFAYLLHQEPAPVHKDILCELMWPDCEPKKASHYLQTIIYQLRKSIAEVADNRIVIEYADHCYRLKLDCVSYDVKTFHCAYRNAFAQRNPEIGDLVEAEQIYTGPYYGEECWVWALGKQQSLSIKYQRVLEQIIEYKMRSGIIDETLFYIEKWFAGGFYGRQGQYSAWIKEFTGR
ncbi:response regulator [Anoxybacterium hadale]|uniref:Response regulator n=1 Tax=Anoxybacterium hadale TaxID=3408580 RepID=A0ACD1A6M9_9FIRM|nr:response regulator [Clostridiales bacterium]